MSLTRTYKLTDIEKAKRAHLRAAVAETILDTEKALEENLSPDQREEKMAHLDELNRFAEHLKKNSECCDGSVLRFFSDKEMKVYLKDAGAEHLSTFFRWPLSHTQRICLRGGEELPEVLAVLYKNYHRRADSQARLPAINVPQQHWFSPVFAGLEGHL